MASSHASSAFAAYREMLDRAASTVESSAIERASDLLLSALKDDRTIFACGNGGSTSIVNHMVCDFNKGISTDTAFKPRFFSLTSEVSLVTAAGNDCGYEESLRLPLSIWLRKGDLLLAVSSSGNSPNILRALEYARENGAATILLSGFSGGRAASLADVVLHVKSDNYGVVEDVHQMLLHSLSQHIRTTHAVAGAPLKL